MNKTTNEIFPNNQQPNSHTNLNFYKNTVTDTWYRICLCPTSKWSELTETKPVPCISSAMCTIRYSWYSLKYHWKWKWSHSVVSDSEIPWIVAYQASPSMGFSRQVYQSGLPFPSPRDLPDPGIKSGSLALQADALPSELS